MEIVKNSNIIHDKEEVNYFAPKKKKKCAWQSYLDKLKAHEKPCRAQHLSFAVIEWDCTDTWLQFRNWQTSLASKIILLRHIILMHFNSKQGQFRNRQWELKFFIPNGSPIILFCLCFLHNLIGWYPCYAHLPCRSIDKYMLNKDP